MTQIYDQDNFRTSYSRSLSPDISRYERQAKNITQKSTMTTAKKERPRVIKSQQKRRERLRRLGALAVACMITGGVAVNTVSNLFETMHNNAIVYEQTSKFKKEVISPNTFRTADNKDYYYDYYGIAEAIDEEGKDFSAELYKSYATIGEEQTDHVMSYTDYESVEDYALSAGFKDVDGWVKSERKKMILQSEVNDKKTELEAMHSEFNDSKGIDSVQDNYTGGK